jgi:hypothetical protein
VFDTAIQNFISSAGNALLSAVGDPDLLIQNETSISALSGSPAGIWNNQYGDVWYFENFGHVKSGNVTERTFYTEMMKEVYDNLSTSQIAWTLNNGEDIRETQFFKNIMFKLHNDLIGAIRTGMINSEGNITRYSLKNEIVQIKINLEYTFE